jgi:tripartite-type tricarboxylate transporter receptor subunit TctC
MLKTHLVAGLLAPLVFAVPASAQYPNKPVTLVAPFAAGGDSDLSARNLAQAAQRFLGQPVVVVNRAGASGTIGSQSVRAAAPDGYTLLLARVGSHAVSTALDSKVPYKWNDFTFLSILEFNPFVCVVRGDSPYRTMGDLVDAIRKQPGKLAYASTGNTSLQFMGPQVLFGSTGLKSDAALHVPYKGSGDTTAALLGKQVDFQCNNLTTLVSQIKGGTFRALMTTTPKRLEDLPDVPTSRDLGWPDMEKVTGWSALYGPPGLPAEVTGRWAAVLRSLSGDPEWLAGNAKIGGVPGIISAAETERFAKAQYEMYEALADKLKLKE